MSLRLMIFFGLCITLLADQSYTKEVTPQQRLVTNLFRDYDKRVLPVEYANGPVNVTFRLNLYQILEVNEAQQFVTLNAWISERWDDEMLYWNPEKYGGIRRVNIPWEYVWLPDTTLYNSLTMKDEDQRRLLNVRLEVNETQRATHVELMYPAIFTFSCRLNVLYFPIDEQNCSLIFGSWTMDMRGIDYALQTEVADLHSYIEHEAWSLLSLQTVRHSLMYKCCPHPFVLVYYNLRIKRKPLFYVINLIIPTSIITLIALVGFFMPSSAQGERMEKVSLGISTLLSMSILLLMVSDSMPKTASFVPLISWFYLSMIGLISSGTMVSSLVIVIQRKSVRGMGVPRGLLPPLLLLSTLTLHPVPHHLRHRDKSWELYGSSLTQLHKNQKFKTFLPQKKMGTKDTILEGFDEENKRYSICSDDEKCGEEGGVGGVGGGVGGGGSGDETPLNRKTKRCLKILCAIQRNTQDLMTRVQESRVHSLAEKEWEWLAGVVERLILVLFVSLQVILIVKLFFFTYF